MNIKEIYIRKIDTMGYNYKLFNLTYYIEIGLDKKLKIEPLGGYQDVVYTIMWYFNIKNFKIKLPINKKKYSKIENELNYNHNYIYLINGYNNPIQEKVSRKIGKVLFYLFWYLPIFFLNIRQISLIKQMVGRNIYDIPLNVWHKASEKFSFYLKCDNM